MVPIRDNLCIGYIMTNDKKISIINDRIRFYEEEKSSLQDQDKINNINKIIEALNQHLLTIGQ